MRFWDASALVPLLIEQKFSETAQRLFREEKQAPLVWWASAIECASAISRLERERRTSTRVCDQALLSLKKLSRVWNEVQPTQILRDKAVRLLRLHPLRAGDAQQLAAALIASEDLATPLPFVCFDDRLASAARREGFDVVGV